jgi:hypothetical protein
MVTSKAMRDWPLNDPQNWVSSTKTNHRADITNSAKVRHPSKHSSLKA